MKSYPWTAEASESMWVGVVAVVQLDVVVATVGFLLHLEGDEAQLDAVALLGRQQPLAVGVTGIVAVSKLGVGVKVLLASFGFQTTATLCRDTGSGESDLFSSSIRHLSDFLFVRYSR